MDGFAPAIDRIIQRRREVSPDRAVLVAISGIDGSGKGFMTERIARRLTELALPPAVIHLDDWFKLPAERFDPARPAEHFYEQSFRFREMFDDLVFPLRDNRSIRLDALHSDSTMATEYFPHRYEFDQVDLVLLEGIFLLKREFRGDYDLSIWVDCTFETALERALLRGQEGLPREETIRDYDTIYFPAERIHLAQDTPKEIANVVIRNDPRLNG